MPYPKMYCTSAVPRTLFLYELLCRERYNDFFLRSVRDQYLLLLAISMILFILLNIDDIIYLFRLGTRIDLLLGSAEYIARLQCPCYAIADYADASIDPNL